MTLSQLPPIMPNRDRCPCSKLIPRRKATSLRFARATYSWFVFIVLDSEGFSNHPESAIVDVWQWGESIMFLKTMTVSKLKDLKRQVEAAIHAKVTERRHEIESELYKLSLLDSGGRGKVVRAAARGMVAVKVGKKPKASTPNHSRKARNVRKAANTAETGFSTLALADHIDPLPIETRPVDSIDANVVPADLSVRPKTS